VGGGDSGVVPCPPPDPQRPWPTGPDPQTPYARARRAACLGVLQQVFPHSRDRASLKAEARRLSLPPAASGRRGLANHLVGLVGV